MPIIVGPAVMDVLFTCLLQNTAHIAVSADDAVRRCWWTIGIMREIVHQHRRRYRKPKAKPTSAASART